MPKFDVDLTTPTVEEGEHIAVVQTVLYQEKFGEKWNNEGTRDVTPEVWGSLANDKKRLQVRLSVPGTKGPMTLFHEFYFSGSTPEKAAKAREITGRNLGAMGVKIAEDGFDPDEALNNSVGISVAMTQDAGYEPRPKITKFYRA